MKTGELARALGYTERTLRNWIDRPELDGFFSPGAKKSGGAHRLLTDSDVLILNTIRYLKASGTHDWEEITAYLKTGNREQEFPLTASDFEHRTIPLPQAEQGARLLLVTRERDAALALVQELTGKLHDTEAALRQSLADRDTLREEYLREIANLQKRIGYLEGYLAALKEQDGGGATE